jgi:broad specificity phosphatase PhoE
MGETNDDVRMRLQNFIDVELKPLLENGTNTYLVVTHGTPATLLMELLNHEEVHLDNAEFVIVKVDNSLTLNL